MRGKLSAYTKFLLVFFQPGLRGWHIVFLMGGGIYILCGIVFILIGTAKKQDFNEKQLGGATAPAT